MTTTWEYLFVDVAYHKDKWLVRWMNGSEVPDWKNGTEIAALANNLGAEGWELVSMAGPVPMHYVLKRPKT